MSSEPHSELQFVVDENVAPLGVPLACALICGLDNHPHDERDGPNDEGADDPQWGRFSSAFIESDPVLRGYRELHTAVGRSNKRFVSSSEALVRSFLRTRAMSRVNPAVDIYNRLSLETLLSIGAHDAAKIEGDVSFRLTDGGERFVALGSESREVPVPIQAGEYGYVDGNRDLLCRMECRQAEGSKLDAGSEDCVFIVQGNPNTPAAAVQRTLDVLLERVIARCGGRARLLHSATG